MTKILVFIPTYRCESQIGRVLKQFDSRVMAWVDTILVVDNQSPDKTMSIAIERGQQALAKANFVVLRNDENYGLGGSHKAAFNFAVDNNFDYLIVLHGDDQADIRDLIPHLEAGLHMGCDCLLGSRFMQGSHLKGYSLLRTLGNRLYNFLFSVVARQTIRDLGSGLNLYRLSSYRDCYYRAFPDDLTFNYVMLLASYHRGQIVRFFPITWREEDQLSNVKLVRQSLRVLGLLVSYGLAPRDFLAKDLRSRHFGTYSGQIQYDHKSNSSDPHRET
jgi:glycosyltransferase involved in cell wall biosynthesis